MRLCGFFLTNSEPPAQLCTANASVNANAVIAKRHLIAFCAPMTTLWSQQVNLVSLSNQKVMVVDAMAYRVSATPTDSATRALRIMSKL